MFVFCIVFIFVVTEIREPEGICFVILFIPFRSAPDKLASVRFYYQLRYVTPVLGHLNVLRSCD